MQFLKIYFILFYNFILAIAATSNNGKGGRLIYDKYLKKGNQIAAQQLNLQFQTPVIANTTGQLNVYVDSNNHPGVNIIVSFTCPGLIIRPVQTTLEPQNTFVDFQVPSNMNGLCSAVASAEPPANYDPSDPVSLTVGTPLYFEGSDGDTFNTGDILDIYVKASNNAVFSTTFKISCVSGQMQSIPIVTSTTTKYVLPPNLIGTCEFSTPNADVPSGYIPITPITVTISPTIYFTSPAENAFYSPGSTITATLKASDGATSVQASVRLNCNGNDIQTVGPQSISSTFTFSPASAIYGTCTLSITSVTPSTYYYDETVTIQYQSKLTFISPTFGLIPPGTTFNIEVAGTSGTNAVNVNVLCQCSNGQSFSYNVPLVDSTPVIMNSNALGTCTLTATTSIPNFVPAATKVEVYTPLNPAQVAQAAQSLAINGIFS